MATTPDVTNTLFTDLGLAKTPTAHTPTKTLGQAEFFELMLAQLKHQDPLKPLDNTEFVGQMAQFSTVDSLTSIDTSMTEMASAFQSNQALQASTLVGREVLVPSPAGLLGDSGMAGAVEVPGGATNVTVTVLDSRGVQVAQLPLTGAASGTVPFSWDGRNANGDRLPNGAYTVVASGQVGDNGEQLETLVRTGVESVTLRQNPPGTTLNLAGLGPVDMSVVRELR